METLTSDPSDPPPPPPPPPPLAPLTPPPLGDGPSEKPAVDGDDDSQIVLSPQVEPSAEQPSPMSILLAAALPAVEATASSPQAIGVSVKRKRGRPPKSKGGDAAGTAAVKRPAVAKGKEEEDVCFVCFDGGDLVVCDRRGCPKVYHPFCVNREASFFRTKGRWNCGWHICSICTKAANYMCYTCTYSLCKLCIRNANFSCVRGNNGFCENCLKIVTSIESNGHVNGEKVDFDDKSTWEYLFKLYWLAVKKKLMITVEELKNARNPHKRSASARHDVISSNELCVANVRQEACFDNSLGRYEGIDISREKPEKQTIKPVGGEGSNKFVDGSAHYKSLDKNSINEPKALPENNHWASPALLEFVSFMKHGDTSPLTKLAVQELLVQYVEKNILCDPDNKNKIICDKMLLNLFGKPCMENFEMLNLIESHFSGKVASQTDGSHGGIADPVSAQIVTEKSCDISTYCDKKRKNMNSFDDYAAIDIHNINLIYLHRNSIEDLLDDMNLFSKKVIGSFVRMKIPDIDRKQDMFRLVPVVGIKTVAEKYNVGNKTIDVALEVLNLGEREVLPIDTISEDDFTEVECRQLRQSMECGLIKRLKVGVVQEKAKLFQAFRVNQWLESERTRLSHLRDQASEAGCTEELRHYEEKLQLLSTPEEQIHRLNEILEIHLDPSMNPNCESCDEETKQMKKESKELISLRTRGTDASNNLTAMKKDSGSISLSSQSCEHLSMKSADISVPESANCSELKGDIPKSQENIAASSSGNNQKQIVKNCTSDAAKTLGSSGEGFDIGKSNPSSLFQEYQDISVRESANHSGPKGDILKPQENIATPSGDTQTQIVENCTSDTAKTLGSSGDGFDIKKSNPSSLFQQSQEICVDAKLQCALVPTGQCNDAPNPPYFTPDLNDGDSTSVTKPVSIHSTSLVIIDSMNSINVSQIPENISTGKVLPLVQTNEPFEAHVASVTERSVTRCQLQEHSCAHENEPAVVKVTETQKKKTPAAAPDDGGKALFSPCVKEEKRISRCLPEEKQVSEVVEDEKMSSHLEGASPASLALCLKLNSELQEFYASAHKDNLDDNNPLSGVMLEQNKIKKTGPSLLIPDQMKLSKQESTEGKSFEWLLLSPPSTSKPPDWNTLPSTMSGNNHNKPFLHGDELTTPKDSTDSFVFVIPVNNSEDEDTLSKCLEEALQMNEDRGSSVANEDAKVSGKELKVDMNPGWGVPSIGNINLDWEPLSPVHAYTSEGWGAFLQGNATAEWGALSPAHANTQGLEAFLPVHSSADWGVLSPVQSNSNVCWTTPSHGNMNLNVGWGESIPGNTSPIWGSSSLERPVTLDMLGWNTDLNLDTRQRSYQSACCGGSELGSDNNKGLLNGDCNPRQNIEYRASPFGAGGGRNSRNGYYSSDNGGFLHQSDRGLIKGQRGVCKFCGRGNCLKGELCKYRHPGYHE